MINAFSFFAAWLLLIIILAMIAQTAWGKPIVYYTLWLMIVFAIVTHANEITSILSATGLVSSTQPTTGTSQPATGGGPPDLGTTTSTGIPTNFGNETYGTTI